MKDNGASVGPGSREPSPAVSAASGFDPSRVLEFRPDHKGRFDEIVARFADGMVHVETMTDKSCYVGFYWDDGRYCQWWISSDKKLSYHHEDGQLAVPRFTAWGVDRSSDSDGSPEGGDKGTLGSVHDGAGPKDIAQ